MHPIVLLTTVFSGEVPELRKELATSNESQMKDAVKKVCAGFRSGARRPVSGVYTASEPGNLALVYTSYRHTRQWVTYSRSPPLYTLPYPLLQVIAGLTIGKDMSSLFPDVLNCIRVGM